MIIIGSGMSGMLAAQYFRSKDGVKIVEKQPNLPHNHKALLRFRTNAVSTLTGISFNKVKVQKAIFHNDKIIKNSNFALSNMYSQKVLGCVRNRSIGNLEDCERYVAPEDFIEKLSRGIEIVYNIDATSVIQNMIQRKERVPIISTMPVMALANILGYENIPTLQSMPICTFKVKIEGLDIDVYQTLYSPGNEDWYRASITGDTLIVEYTKPPTINHKSFYFRAIFNLFGISVPVGSKTHIEFAEQRHGKLLECNTNQVKKFIGYVSQKYQIYSLGRWGTHRQILMDDVVNDIKVIDSLIKSDNYKGVS